MNKKVYTAPELRRVISAVHPSRGLLFGGLILGAL